MSEIKSLYYVTYQAFPGDTANSIQTISNLKYLSKNNVDATLFFPLRETESSDDLNIINEKYSTNVDFKIIGTQHNLPFGKFKFFNSFFFIISHYLWSKKTINNLLKEYPLPDVFITRSDWVFYFLSKSGHNVIFEYHQNSKLRSYLTKKSIKNKDSKIIFLNNNLYQDFSNKSALGERYEILQNGVDLEKFKYKVKKNKNEIIFVGSLKRFNKSRNIEFIIESLKKLNLNYVFKIVGASKKEITSLKKLIKNCDIEKNIIFYNRLSHEETIKHLAGAEIGILINSESSNHSIKYTSPIKYFEYLAAELKILAVDFDSHRKLPFNENIIFFKNGDFNSFKLGLENINRTQHIERKLLDKISLDERAKNIIKLASV